MGARHYRTNLDPLQEELAGIWTKPHPQTNELRWRLKCRIANGNFYAARLYELLFLLWLVLLRFGFLRLGVGWQHRFHQRAVGAVEEADDAFLAAGGD